MIVIVKAQKSNDVFTPDGPIITHGLMLNIKSILLIDFLVGDRSVLMEMFVQYESTIRFGYQGNDQSNQLLSTKYANIDFSSLGLIKILEILFQNDFSIISNTTNSATQGVIQDFIFLRNSASRKKKIVFGDHGQELHQQIEIDITIQTVNSTNKDERLR